MAKQYQMIRLERSTWEALASISQQMLNAYQIGAIQLPDSQCEHVTLDYVVQTLIGQRKAHAERRRAYSQRKVSKSEPSEACIQQSQV